MIRQQPSLEKVLNPNPYPREDNIHTSLPWRREDFFIIIRPGRTALAQFDAPQIILAKTFN